MSLTEKEKEDYIKLYQGFKRGGACDPEELRSLKKAPDLIKKLIVSGVDSYNSMTGLIAASSESIDRYMERLSDRFTEGSFSGNVLAYMVTQLKFKNTYTLTKEKFTTIRGRQLPPDFQLGNEYLDNADLYPMLLLIEDVVLVIHYADIVFESQGSMKRRIRRIYGEVYNPKLRGSSTVNITLAAPDMESRTYGEFMANISKHDSPATIFGSGTLLQDLAAFIMNFIVLSQHHQERLLKGKVEFNTARAELEKQIGSAPAKGALKKALKKEKPYKFIDVDLSLKRIRRYIPRDVNDGPPKGAHYRRPHEHSYWVGSKKDPASRRLIKKRIGVVPVNNPDFDPPEWFQNIKKA
jgi:hypothetical protein